MSGATDVSMLGSYWGLAFPYLHLSLDLRLGIPFRPGLATYACSWTFCQLSLAFINRVLYEYFS